MLLIEDSLDFIIENYKNFTFHIASGSDNNELNQICKHLNISNYFSSINGSPTPKIEIVKRIISDHEIQPQEYALVGDSINDYEAAKENGIHFYAYNNEALKASHDYIDSFAIFNGHST